MQVNEVVAEIVGKGRSGEDIYLWSCEAFRYVCFVYVECYVKKIVSFEIGQAI